VALAEHNNVVEAFPADRTDQPFSILASHSWPHAQQPNAYSWINAEFEAEV
jgi:hypothetical protein